MSAEENMKLMRSWMMHGTHKIVSLLLSVTANNVIVPWPAQPPTERIVAHRKEGEYFFKAFPDNYVANNPYKVLFGQDDWTCSIAEFTGTHKGQMMGLDGKTIEPTNKKFKVDFCTGGTLE